MKNEVNKKMEILRVVIYTVIVMLLIFGLNHLLPENASTSIGMMTPLTAHILTRLLTRDKTDIDGLYLRAHLKGNVKYYWYALLYGVALNLIGGILTRIFIFPNDGFLPADKLHSALCQIPLTFSMTFMLMTVCLGEEYGWRAYLTPKLETFLPDWAVFMVQGIIWGMWHKDMLDAGGNFGKDHAFYPWANYVLMCISCMFFGMFLTYLTRKTHSIYPAAICHSAIDCIQVGALLYPDLPEDFNETHGEIVFHVGILSLIPFSVIVGTIAFILMQKDKKVKIIANTPQTPLENVA